MHSGERRRIGRRVSGRRSNRRRWPRLIVPGLPVRLLREADGEKTVTAGRLLDISPGGVRLAVDEPVAADEVLLIEVRLEAGCLNLSARVTWTKPESDGVAVGCRLSAPPAGEKLAELRRLVETTV